VTLVSVRGERTLPYREFHLGYKRTALAPDELLYSINVPLACRGWKQYIRKVGTRNAQAISKVAIAAVTRMSGDRVEGIRVGAASLADRPVRCLGAEAALQGRSLQRQSLEDAVRTVRAAIALEAKPIDDIRSTAAYRSAVAANLMEEFVRSLSI
jgi:CO/xanthine dehydrogenase FAD-binding subunit